MKNIHILPTDKPSRLYLGINRNFVFGMMQTSIQSINNDFTNQHIHITSKEEIKEGDWWINLDDSNIYHTIFWQLANNAPSCKKIVLTTDPDLIKDGVQAIDDEFLEWFVKNPSCERVKVEKMFNVVQFTSREFIYRIIIPKEEHKQEKRYSEEEVIEILIEYDYSKINDDKLNSVGMIKEWFKQFKNK